MQMLTTLRSRLLASYVLIVVICLTVTGVIFALLLIPQATRLTYLRLAERALPAALRGLSLRGQDLSPSETLAALEERITAGGARALIVSADGRVLADSEEAWVGRGIELSVPEDGGPASKVYAQGRLLTREGLFFYVAVPSNTRAAGQGAQASLWYLVLLAQPRQVITALLADISVGFVFTGAVALLLSVGVAFAISRSVAKPLQRITTATEEIAHGNYEERLEITSPEEVRRLAISFNSMAHEVQSSRQAQRDFVTNVSHDLKTPLTSIRGFSQAILDGTTNGEESRRAAQIINEEAERMARLVDDLLDLARIEAGQAVMARERVDLSQLVQDSAEAMALRARDAGVELLVEAEPRLSVLGDRDRLAQVVSNLLDNALKHTPSGGRITLAVDCAPGEAEPNASRPGSWTQITVSDTGGGIPREDLGRIFDRFYRADKSRAGADRGAGLGLTIAQEIILAHGGKITADSVPGLGTKFTIILPQHSDMADPRQK